VKLRVQEVPDRDAQRRIAAALLQADVGGRVNFDMAAQVVRLESRLTVEQAIAAIARSGYQVAAIVDATISDRAYSPAR
jgi:hypothetical protein